jgi:hypothetical protein
MFFRISAPLRSTPVFDRRRYPLATGHLRSTGSDRCCVSRLTEWVPNWTCELAHSEAETWIRRIPEPTEFVGPVIGNHPRDVPEIGFEPPWVLLLHSEATKWLRAGLRPHRRPEKWKRDPGCGAPVLRPRRRGCSWHDTGSIAAVCAHTFEVLPARFFARSGSLVGEVDLPEDGRVLEMAHFPVRLKESRLDSRSGPPDR